MPITEYIKITAAPSFKSAARWFILSWWGILLSSLYALFIVLFRVLGINSSMDTFQRALVGHVNLGIIVSLLSFACGLFSLAIKGERPGWERLSIFLSWTGGFLIALSPLTSGSKPVMNDYIPIIRDKVFILGLALFGTGTISVSLHTLISLFYKRNKTGFEWFISGGALSILIAAVNIAIALILMPNKTYDRYFFQQIFWGGGHILLFCHTILMLLSWHILSNKPINASTLKIFILSVTVPVIISPVIPIFFSIGSQSYRSFFTYIMSLLGFITLIILVTIHKFSREESSLSDNNKHDISIFYYISIILFITGSAIGIFIREDNSLVPAHYHGVIGAVTAAYMGLTLKYMDIKASLLNKAKIQGFLYGIGLILMMAGLILNNYPRKEIVSTDYSLIGRILFGAGGVLSIAGNLLFVFLTGFKPYQTNTCYGLSKSLER